VSTIAPAPPPAPPAPPAPVGPPAPAPAPLAPAVMLSPFVPSPISFTLANVPSLAKPMSIDIDSINMLIGALNYAITREQVKTGTASIDADNAAKLEMNKKIKEQLEAIKTKAAEAKEAAGEDKVAGWCEAIGLLVAAGLACAAVVFSGGASAALAVLAVAGAVMAIQDVVNMSLKEAGTQYTACTGETKQLDVSFNGMIDAIVDRQLVDGTIVEVHEDTVNGGWLDKNNKKVDTSKPGPLYFTKEELADWKMGWSVTTTLLITAAMMVTGYGAYKGWGAITKVVDAADKSAKAAKTASAAERVTEGMSVVADVEAASAQIYQGSVGVKLAEINSDTDRARAYKAYYDSMIKEIGQRMGLAHEAIQTLVERMNEIYDAMSKSVAEASQNYQQSAEAIGFNPQGA
jgi:hypothetical protein